jgi:hypothetical protein
MRLFAFDLYPLQSDDFSMDARNLIIPVFDTSQLALDKEWTEYEKRFHEYISKLGLEEEVLMADQERDWEEELHRQRLQGIGSMALDWLMCSLQLNLNGAKRYFDKTHPGRGEYKSKNGWLGKVRKDYGERFKIEFEAGPVPFIRIRELVLARNAGVHREPEDLECYLEKVKDPRFVDDEDRFSVTRDALLLTVADCEQFLSWVVSELRKLRKPEPVERISQKK